MEMTRRERDLMIEALKTEYRTTKNLMNELERRNFHNGDQNMAIQNRLREITALVVKLEEANLSE